MDGCILQEVPEEPTGAIPARLGGPTPQAVCDQLEIQKLIADRAYAFDEQDAEGMAALFVRDGCLEFYYPGDGEPAARYETSSAIVETMRLYFEPPHSGLLTRTHYSSMRFDVLATYRAQARAIFLATGQTPEREEPVALLSGVTEWEFERTTTGWRFRRASGYNDRRRWLDRPWLP